MRAATLSNALRLLGLVASVLLLGACSRHDSGHDSAKAEPDGGKREHVVSVSSGISLDGDKLTLRRGTLPEAVITPTGDLVLGGKTVTTSEPQRQAMTAYRKQVQAITLQGVELGKAGARLGADAAGEAIKGLFNGEVDKIGDKVEAQADAIKKEALKLCDQVELLRLAQDAAVQRVPEFKPYSQVDQDDVAECRK
ncbi:MAG TPA: DUF2884 family protein [Stenotrophomonas sp.]|nr:DUF2884 family protein [Stenotrophomonas sp.]